MKAQAKEAHAKAVDWFIKHGHDMNGKELHHIDMSLKHNDKRRYDQWNPEDLVPLTKQAHMALHMKVRNKKGTMKKRSHKKAISNGIREHYKNFKNCLWRIWHEDTYAYGKLIPAEDLTFRTCAEAAKYIGCTKQLVSLAASRKQGNICAKGWMVEKLQA